MKAMLAVSSLALLVLTAVGASAQMSKTFYWHDAFKPRDPVIKQAGHYEWSWDGGDSLGLAAPAALHYTPEGAPRIVITGPDDLLTHVQVGQGQIRIDPDWRNSGNEHLQVIVTGVTVHYIAVAGSGSASLEKLSLDHLGLAIAGSGTVSLEKSNLDQLNLALTGSGAVTGDGRAQHVILSVTGSGKADLSRLSAETATIHVLGSGGVQLTPRDSATVSVAGSGIVRMTARPAHITQSVTGSGGVRIDGD